jgi:hypothetical protein
VAKRHALSESTICTWREIFSAHRINTFQTSGVSRFCSLQLCRKIEPRSKAPVYESDHTAPGFCCRCLRQVLAHLRPSAKSAFAPLLEYERTHLGHHGIDAPDPLRPWAF